MAESKLKVPEAARGHTYLVGGTGAGKSEMLKVLIWETIRHNKASIVILDPKNDLAQEVARFINHTLPSRKNKLVYLSPFDFPGKTYVLNPLQLPPVTVDYYEEFVDISTKELTRTLQNIFVEMDNGFTGLMQSVLSPCIETLLRKGDGDFWDLQRFMDNKINGDLIEQGLKSPNESVRRFFAYDFPNLSQATKDGIKWRTRMLLQSQIFARLTTGKSTINLYELVNQGKCIIFNLNKGKMSADVSSYMGKFIVSMLQIIAQQRGGIPHSRKQPIHCFLDEWHNYTTKGIKDTLSEARSNKLFLTLSQQLVGQDMTDRNFKKILMGNTNVKILAQSTHENYKELTDDFGIETEHLQQLPKYHFYIKVGHGAAIKVKGWNGLIKDKNSMSEGQWRALVKEQLTTYYVPISQRKEIKRTQEEQRMSYKEVQATIDQKKKGKPSNNNMDLPDSPLYPLE